MTPADLQHFLDERHMQRKQFGAAIEVSQNRLRRWLDGKQRIPRHIALAVAALVYDLPEWPYSQT
jgi:plasmid maintenance system antidote protein VapI